MDSAELSMMMIEDSLGQFKEGEVVTGVITSVDKDMVLVDIGYKSEGQIRINEFRGEDGSITAKIGDTIEVMVEWWDDEDERVILSKDKAANVKVWESIKKCHDDDGTITGTISSRVKGGFSVDIGVLAFLPGSQADLRPIRNLDEMVGKTFDFKILKYNRKRSNIVLSRRVLLEKERESKRSATLSSIHEGKVLQGTVKNITEYGVFVDLGGVDGLLHITDISWGRVKQPGPRKRARLSGDEAVDSGSVEHGGADVPGRLQGDGACGQPDRLRCLRGTAGGYRGPDPCLRDVLDPQGPPSLQGGLGG